MEYTSCGTLREIAGRIAISKPVLLWKPRFSRGIKTRLIYGSRFKVCSNLQSLSGPASSLIALLACFLLPLSCFARGEAAGFAQAKPSLTERKDKPDAAPKQPDEFRLPADVVQLPDSAVDRLNLLGICFDTLYDSKGALIGSRKGPQTVIAGAAYIGNDTQYAVYAMTVQFELFYAGNNPVFSAPTTFWFRQGSDKGSHGVVGSRSTREILTQLRQTMSDSHLADAKFTPLEPDKPQCGAGVVTIPQDRLSSRYTIRVIAAWGVVQPYPADLKKAVVLATKHDDAAAVDGMLQQLPSLQDGVYDNGWNLLQTAAYNHADSAVKILLQRGMNVNEPNASGQMPLQLAAAFMKGYDAMTTLLNSGALINHTDKEGQTALHWAIRAGSQPTADLLLRYGADITIRDKSGKLAAEYAASLDDTNNILYHTKRRELSLKTTKQLLRGESSWRTSDTFFRGTVQSIATDRSTMTMLVSEITLPGGEKVGFNAQRPKTVKFENDVFFGAASKRGNVQLSSPNALLPGTPVICSGFNEGDGKVLNSAFVVTLTDPGVNLSKPFSDASGWRVETSGAQAREHHSIKDGGMSITVENADGVGRHVLLIPTKAVSLVRGSQYRITVRARADKPFFCRIQCKIDLQDGHDLAPLRDFTATSDWQTFTFTVTPENVLDGHNIAPVFFLGKDNGTIYLADVAISAME